MNALSIFCLCFNLFFFVLLHFFKKRFKYCSVPMKQFTRKHKTSKNAELVNLGYGGGDYRLISVD